MHALIRHTIAVVAIVMVSAHPAHAGNGGGYKGNPGSHQKGVNTWHQASGNWYAGNQRFYRPQSRYYAHNYYAPRYYGGNYYVRPLYGGFGYSTPVIVAPLAVAQPTVEVVARQTPRVPDGSEVKIGVVLTAAPKRVSLRVGQSMHRLELTGWDEESMSVKLPKLNLSEIKPAKIYVFDRRIEQVAAVDVVLVP